MQIPNATRDSTHPGMSLSQARPACPGCCGRSSQKILRLPRVPVNCSALWLNSLAARRCVTGSIELRSCQNCGLVFNALFDAAVLEYDTQYDNSLDFSPAFRAYAEDLARELVSVYDLRRKRIVEVGCGNGAFLQSLCSQGRNTGIGFDPSFSGDEDPHSDVKFVRAYFGREEAEQGFDFLCCRHVLEHLEKPFEFLRMLSGISAGSPAATFYFEVPNGDFVLRGNGFWDIIYPHVSYFTEASLVSLFERAAFKVLRSGKRFSDQFLFIEARVCGETDRQSRGRIQPPAGIDTRPRAIQSHFTKELKRWSSCIEQLSAQTGKPPVLWGAGAKGVSFLNLVPTASRIGTVIDSNPRKQGMFVPGTGQRIATPGELGALSPAAVIVLNSAYRDEISALLGAKNIPAWVMSQPELAA